MQAKERQYREDMETSDRICPTTRTPSPGWSNNKQLLDEVAGAETLQISSAAWQQLSCTSSANTSEQDYRFPRRESRPSSKSENNLTCLPPWQRQPKGMCPPQTTFGPAPAAPSGSSNGDGGRGFQGQGAARCGSGVFAPGEARGRSLTVAQSFMRRLGVHQSSVTSRCMSSRRVSLPKR